MKTEGYLISNYTLAFIGVMVITLLASCTSSKDIWNPNKEQSYATRSNLSEYNKSSKEMEPEWLYNVSSEFIVGFGQGSSNYEAKHNAMRDIKIQVVKFLGEEVSIEESISIDNIVTGRNVRSQEVFQLDKRFKSEFGNTIIDINPQNIINNYWHNSGASVKYYIKYSFGSTEIDKILGESIKRANKIKNLVDSLVDINQLGTLNELQYRLSELRYIQSSGKIKFIDSLKIDNAIRRIKYNFDNLAINILSEEPGKITFTLKNYDVEIVYSAKPEIIAPTGINIENIYVRDGIWTIEYSNPKNIIGTIYIYYENNDFALYSEVDIKKTAEFSDKEKRTSTNDIDVEKVYINCIDMSFWDGNVQEIEIMVSVISNNSSNINTIELELVANNGTRKIIDFNKLIELENGINRVVWRESCNLPQKFLRLVHYCNVNINYKQSINNQTQNFKSIPIIIKNI